MPFAECYRGKRVLVTGHTGFKGGWLCEWLLSLGAEVTGLALAPSTRPALFAQIGLAGRLQHREGDIRDPEIVRQAVSASQPDFVFHLAAQPLVRLSYQRPLDTYTTNVMGTLHLLEALRELTRPCAVIIVTSDKCYENRETVHDYHEDEALGGYDPYSSSKAACEVAVASWRRSFFKDHPAKIASVRAGNVIGGGDWALDRIVPDCIRSLQGGHSIPVRNPKATRPWQHVLEPLSGYLWLAAALAEAYPVRTPDELCSAFNFGPASASNRTVGDLVKELLKHWPGQWEDRHDSKASHEATLLSLSVKKARLILDWKPTWDFETTVEETVAWYRANEQAPKETARFTLAQIERYTKSSFLTNSAWSR